MNNHQVLLFPFQFHRSRPGCDGLFEEADEVLEGLFMLVCIFWHGIHR
jgi:hypothetical protein